MTQEIRNKSLTTQANWYLNIQEYVQDPKTQQWTPVLADPMGESSHVETARFRR